MPDADGGGAAEHYPLPPLRWRVRIDGAASGARNMAVDQTLAQAVEERRPDDLAILRLYRWARPTVSFGRNEPARGRYDLEAAARAGIDFVRRPTGGRAVLHHEELTYCVAAPLDAFGGLRRSYLRINEALVAGLRVLGVPAGLAAPEGRAATPDAGPCFREPAVGEVVTKAPGTGEDGAAAVTFKIAGSAQLRIGRTLLQHGSLPLSGSQARLEALLHPAAEPLPVRAGAPGDGGAGAPCGPGADADARAAEGHLGLAGVAGRRLLWEEVACAIGIGFQEIFGGAWEALDGAIPRRVVAERLRGHYESPEWTWRI